MKSMTGFGKVIKEFNDKTINVEMKSLNSKQMDLNLRLPSLYKGKEIELRTILAKELERGKVDVSIYVDHRITAPDVDVNLELAIAYADKLTVLAKKIDAKTDSLLDIVLKMPEVMKSERKEPDESEWLQIMDSIFECLSELNNFREKEGKELETDLIKRLKNIRENAAKIAVLDDLRIEHIKNRIRKSLSELQNDISVDSNRFEQELIYYLERLDITEEKVRLNVHCEHFLKTLKEQSSGRKINFITQEIGREINTIGSKANDAEIQKLVVEMKDDLEKIKEQSMNIL